MLNSLYLNAQDIPDRPSILTSYGIGRKVLTYVETNDTVALKGLLVPDNDLTDIITLLLEDTQLSNKATTDIYFQPDSNWFVVTIYSGKQVDNGSEWGLYDYSYVLELIVNPDKEKPIQKYKIINGKSIDLKDWWQSFMITYREGKYLRKTWADKFGLVPPPPPPPTSTEWFNE